jgi:hypothetical protein
MRESRILTLFPLPSRERPFDNCSGGPIAEQWEGEGDGATAHIILREPPHPPRCAGPLPLPQGERGKIGGAFV